MLLVFLIKCNHTSFFKMFSDVFFRFFLRELLMFWPPVFRWRARLDCFPACWRQDNVTPIPKGPPYSSVANYRPISIRSVLSKVFECLVSVRLGRLWNSVMCFQLQSMLIGNVWARTLSGHSLSTLSFYHSGE